MKKIQKIAIVGAGNAACLTALHYHLYGRIINDSIDEIEIYHDPSVPIEKVGLGSQLNVTDIIFDVLEMDWYENPIDATFKTGILYEGWGKKQDKIFHSFSGKGNAIHYIPHKLSKCVLESSHFNAIEKSISDPEKEIDANYIIDCRGRHNRDKSNYDTLINPLNAVLLSSKDGKDPDLHYTRTVTTPNGWTFVIPNKDSVSYGYLYNNTITSDKEAKEDFLERFNLSEIDDTLTFENYMAKNVFVGNRTILNGNACGFMEPMEANSTAFFLSVAEFAWDCIFGITSPNKSNHLIKKLMKEIETFILWHYQYGSKYDTAFWEYAKSLPFHPDKKFKELIKNPFNKNELEMKFHSNENFKLEEYAYGQWASPSIKVWKDAME
jgi:hypothetical protein